MREYPSSVLFDNSDLNFRLKRRFFRDLDDLTLLVNSRWLEGQVGLSFLKNEKVAHIPSAVSTDVFVPSNNSLINSLVKDKEFVLIGVANDWSERKGLKDFLLLAEILPKHFRIILVGYDNENGLPENITGISRTDNVKELAALYSGSDVFVNMTYEDNFPTTNLEALSCGIPVITYNTGGSPEAIDSSTGFVCKKGDIESVKEKLMEVENKGKQFFSKACRSRAEQLYSKENVFKKYIELYESLI